MQCYSSIITQYCHSLFRYKTCDYGHLQLSSLKKSTTYGDAGLSPFFHLPHGSYHHVLLLVVDLVNHTFRMTAELVKRLWHCNFFSTKNVRWGAVHYLTIPINENALQQLKLQDQQLIFNKRNCLLKTLSSSVSCVGPVYLVIFCYWVGPVPYLELFGVGPVEKNTLYI